MTTPLLYPADNKDPNRRKHRWPWIALAVVVALFAIGLITNAAKGGTRTVAAQAAPVTVTVTPPRVVKEVKVAPPVCLKVVSLTTDLRSEIDDFADVSLDAVNSAFAHDDAAMTSTAAKIRALNVRLDATRAELDIYGPQCKAAG